MPINRSLAQLAEKAKVSLDVVVRKAALELAQAVILRSPVDSGRFRANWTVGAGAINTATTESVDTQGDQTLGAVNRAIGGVKAGEVIYITNSLPYAQRLEYGWSKQAPAGMVRVTVVEYQKYLDKAVAAL